MDSFILSPILSSIISILLFSGCYQLGKILVNNDYPFGLIKIKEKNLNFDKKYKCNSATIKFIKPFWMN